MDIRSFAERVFEENPTRFTKLEKTALLDKAEAEMLAAGWNRNEIKRQSFKGLGKSMNLIIGDPKAEYLITGHYDTPAANGWIIGTSSLIGQTPANVFTLIATVPVCMLAVGGIAKLAFAAENAFGKAWAFAPVLYMFLVGLFLIFMTLGLMVIKNRNNRNDNTSGTLCVLDCAARAAADPELRKKCCFILFDNEEIGLVGSLQFASWAKKSGIDLSNTTVINLDCVGVGEKLYAARTGRRNEKQKELIERLRSAGLELTEKRSCLVYMSDHANFRNSYMLCYVRKSKLGSAFIPNIHTKKDVECDVGLVDGLAEKIMEAVKA